MIRLLAFVCRCFVISAPFRLRLGGAAVVAIVMVGCVKPTASPAFSKIASYTQPDSQDSEHFEMAFSPDGGQLAIVSSDTAVAIDIQQGTEINQFTLDKGEDIERFAFSTDSPSVLDYQSAAGEEESVAVVKDSQSGEEIWRIDRLVSPESVAISADGQRVATIRDVFGEGAVFVQPLSIWDVSTGEEIAQFESDDECMFGWGNDLSLSAAGDRLATQCFEPAGEGAIAIFDTDQGTRQLLPFAVSARSDFQLSPNGKYLAVRRADGETPNTTVEVWAIEP